MLSEGSIVVQSFITFLNLQIRFPSLLASDDIAEARFFCSQKGGGFEKGLQKRRGR